LGGDIDIVGGLVEADLATSVAGEDILGSLR
jgi:hypothetical protein